MEKGLPAIVVLVALAAVLTGCGTTPQPTVPPPTQTPWIIVVTATPGGVGGSSGAPTQTPWIVVATPTRPGVRAGAPAPTRVARPTPTVAAPPSLKYPAPVPVEPPDRHSVTWHSVVLLQWTQAGNLAEDEYYKLHLERRGQKPGEVWYGDYVYTKELEYRAQGPFLAPFHPPAADGRAEVHWWVSVVQKTGEDEYGKPVGIDLSPKSEERTLLLDPKPEDS